MLASYYQMLTSKPNNSSEYQEYNSNLLSRKNISHRNTSNKCRVCLQKGNIPIFARDNTEETLESLHQFGDITLSENDEQTEYLCLTCSKFLNLAASFRKVAQRSNKILAKLRIDASPKSNAEEDYDDLKPDLESSVEEPASISYIETSFPESQAIRKPIKKETEDITQAQDVNEKDLSYFGKWPSEAKVKCHICNKSISKSYYKQHITIHDPDNKKFICDFCGKSFRLWCSYYTHRSIHSKNYRFKCQLCPYKAQMNERLKIHMRTHTGDYKYMCTECPARFLVKSNLNRHMFRHKEPQFKCDSCDRYFHTKTLLQQHFESDHLGLKNHVCNICGKGFGHRQAMKKHERLVHKLKKNNMMA